MPSNSGCDGLLKPTASTLDRASRLGELEQKLEALQVNLPKHFQDRPASCLVQSQPQHLGSTLLCHLGHYSATNVDPMVMAPSIPRPLTPPSPPSFASTIFLPPTLNYPQTTRDSQNSITRSKSDKYSGSPASARTPRSTYPPPVKIHCSPIREPPAWRLNYKIGTGACGSVFLENVHRPGMKAPELWAVKRIPRALPNFTFKQYQAEIRNLQALANVSFAQTCIISQPAPLSFDLP